MARHLVCIFFFFYSSTRRATSRTRNSDCTTYSKNDVSMPIHSRKKIGALQYLQVSLLRVFELDYD
jgi:hypothetical protein